MFSLDGSERVHHAVANAACTTVEEAQVIGHAVAVHLLAHGADKILLAIRSLSA